MVIKKDSETEPVKHPRGKFRRAIRELNPGESIIIFGDDLDEKTLQRVYTAASRERKRVLTNPEAQGLRVWLNPEFHPAEQPPEVIEEEVSKDEKLANLRAMLSGVESDNLQHISEPAELKEYSQHWTPDEE